MIKVYKVISIFLIGVFLLPSCTLFCLFSSFKIHQTEIAEHHCENKDDPNSDCDGVCYLKKKITHHHSQDMPDHAHIISTLNAFQGLFWQSSENKPLYPLILQDSLSLHQLSLVDGIPMEVFRPPQSTG